MLLWLALKGLVIYKLHVHFYFWISPAGCIRNETITKLQYILCRTPNGHKCVHFLVTTHMSRLIFPFSSQAEFIDWLIDWLRLASIPHGPDAPRPYLSDEPFVPHINSWEPCYFARVPDGPQTYTLDVLWLQEEGAQIHMSEWSQIFTFTKNVGRFHPLLHTSYTMDCLTAPLDEDVSSGYCAQ
jgi:hypothetical protein